MRALATAFTDSKPRMELPELGVGDEDPVGEQGAAVPVPKVRQMTTSRPFRRGISPAGGVGVVHHGHRAAEGLRNRAAARV